MVDKKKIFVVEDEEPDNIVMDVKEEVEKVEPPTKVKKERKKKEYTAEQKAAIVARLKEGKERKRLEREGKTAPKKEAKKETKKEEIKAEIKEIKAEIKQEKNGNHDMTKMNELMSQLKILNGHFESLRKTAVKPAPKSSPLKPENPEKPPEPNAPAKPKPIPEPVRPQTPPMPKTEIYCSRTNTYRYI